MRRKGETKACDEDEDDDDDGGEDEDKEDAIAVDARPIVLSFASLLFLNLISSRDNNCACV